MSRKPVIALTMGDGAGVGPEIIVQALHNREIYDHCHPFVIGDLKILKRAEGIWNTGCGFHVIERPGQALFEYWSIDCLDMDLLPADLPFGRLSAVAGDAAFRYVEKAVQLAMSKEIDAICTAPLNKEAMHMGGHDYPGHTEILAELTHAEHYGMMFSSDDLNVILATIHVGLRESIDLITPERVYNTLVLARDAMKRKLAGKEPRIVVCGLNPHAGENGLFGNGEEEKQIIPGIERARAEGMDVTGPVPADTAFFRARSGRFDIVVAMNHDQGLAPVKVLGIDKSVNITVGLPVIRTSVDHGTAFGHAGNGTARAENMLVALREAWRMCGAE
ncbi:MAG: 4-hydroxythreonine-4-phosphate dehydrogenase PdxA [Oscillospiraceae bacterium]|nr:4-hydroxythreonine-4-phosphate dehydrogenase PdxA [Oscillospiraceae bacterium]